MMSDSDIDAEGETDDEFLSQSPIAYPPLCLLASLAPSPSASPPPFVQISPLHNTPMASHEIQHESITPIEVKPRLIFDSGVFVPSRATMRAKMRESFVRT